MARQRRRRGLVALACVLVLLGGGGRVRGRRRPRRPARPAHRRPRPAALPRPGRRPRGLGAWPVAPPRAPRSTRTPRPPTPPPSPPRSVRCWPRPGLGTHVGASVVDGGTGEVLLAQGDAVPYEPASVAKLLTAAAALGDLRPGRHDHDLRGRWCRATDEVYLVGGGDLLLGAGAGDPAAVVGRAGLADLADQVAAALTASGTTTVRLRLDDSVVGGLGWGAGARPGGRDRRPRQRLPRPAHRAGRRRRPHPPGELRAPGAPTPGRPRRRPSRRRSARAGWPSAGRSPGRRSRTGCRSSGRSSPRRWPRSSATPSRPATTPWRTRSPAWWRSRPARPPTSPAAVAPSWRSSPGSASPSTDWCWPTAAACRTGPGSARAA